MKISLYVTLAAMAFATPSFAGDAAAGEKAFAKCKACHAIVKPDGTAVVKGGKVGPNLFGVVGRTAATYPDFKYGQGILDVGAAGLVWDEALIAEYVVDPTKFIEGHGGTEKSKMTFKLAKGGEDVAAYLATQHE